MLIIVTPATTSPVTVAQAVKHCRAPENGDDDELVERALKSAIEYVEHQTSLLLAPATYELRVPFWPCYSGYSRGAEIVIPHKPVRDVATIEYYDSDALLQTVAGTDWTWRTTSEGAVVRFQNNYSFPTLWVESDEPVRVTFVAGFDAPQSSGSGDDPNLNLPQRAVEAVLLKTELLYDRGGYTADASKHIEMSLASLIGQLRVYR